MKRIKPDPKAIAALLEANKEKAKRRERKETSIAEHPLMRVEGPGTYSFRATYYPHTENPAAEPFLVRHYHFSVPGAGENGRKGIVWCPQENANEKCAICDFVWGQMKAYKGQKDKVRYWSDFLPKARVWIPGKIRGREGEGVKFLSFGTRKEEMSESHAKLFKWFLDPKTEEWMSPKAGRKGGFDIEVEYEKYKEEKSKALKGAQFGFKGINLARDESDFGGDFEAFLDTIPNVDSNDLDILKSYSMKSSKDAADVLKRWMEKLEKDGGGATAKSEEADSGSDDDEDSSSDDSTLDVSDSIRSKLRSMGINA